MKIEDAAVTAKDLEERMRRAPATQQTQVL